jgi:hypothetical protein
VLVHTWKHEMLQQCDYETINGQLLYVEYHQLYWFLFICAFAFEFLKKLVDE